MGPWKAVNNSCTHGNRGLPANAGDKGGNWGLFIGPWNKKKSKQSGLGRSRVIKTESELSRDREAFLNPETEGSHHLDPLNYNLFNK